MNYKSFKNTNLVVICIASFLTPFMSTAINVLLPQIGDELELTAITLSWVVKAFLISAVVPLIFFGRISDTYGRKKLFNLGIIGFSIASFLTMRSSSGTEIIIWRVLQGFCCSMLFSASTPLLISIAGRKQRGKFLGISVATVYLGGTVGPFIAGLVTDYLGGWRSLFMITSVLSIVLLFISLRTMPDLKPTTSNPWFKDLTMLLRKKIFVFALFSALINYCATYSVAFLLSLYLQYIKGFPPRIAGLILLTQAATQMLCSPIAGQLSDKVDPHILTAFAMTTITIFLTVLAFFIGPDTSLIIILVCLFFIGLSFGFFSSPNTNLAMSESPSSSYGIASSILGTSRLAGQCLSMVVVSIMFNALLGDVQISEEHYPALLRAIKSAFGMSSVFCFIGIFTCLSKTAKR